MSKPELLPLAEFIANCKVPRADMPMRSRVRTTLLDWGSAALAGTGHALAARYRTAFLGRGETGTCSAIGSDVQHPLTAAAMTNAAISHLWEVDDAHRDATTHPGITVIPPVLALAEARGLDTAMGAAAIVAGYETVLRIGSHLGAAHYKVNHSTATCGTMGAAAAAARALGLNTERTLWALGHAGTQAAGLWAFLDDNMGSAKAFHAALAVRNGIDAALLAEAGIPGAPYILEGPRGMRSAWGLNRCDPSWLIPGKTPMIHSVTVKGWPVCGQIHSALDCATALATAYPELAVSNSPVTVHLPENAMAIAGFHAPSSVSDAKFSASFCIASVLCGQPPTMTGLTEALVQNPRVQERARSITVLADPGYTARFPKERPARVTLHGPDGDHSETRSYRRGDPEEPWNDADMDQRTREVLGLTHLATDATRLTAWADAFADQSPEWRATELFDCLTGAPG